MKRLLTLLFCFSISIPAFSMTWGDILAQVRLLEKDNVSTSYKWTDQQLLDRANQIQDDVCAKTFCLQSRYYISTSTGIQEYRLPSDCLKIIRAAYAISASSTSFKKLTYTTIAGQDKDNASTWQSTTGLPTEYYRRTDYIGLRPIPSSAYSGTNFIQLDYIVRASSMSSTTDVPFNGDYTLYPFHQAIIYGVAALCEYDKGNTTGYTTMQTVYLDWLMKIYTIVYTEPEKAYLNFTK
jgi:hypothetical protein